MLNQNDDGDINWGHYAIENNWPSTTEKARAKWVYAARGILPYGTYVIVAKTLYVSEQHLLDKLEASFRVIEKAILLENGYEPE